MCKPPVGLGFLGWQEEEKQRTIMEIFDVDHVFYLMQERY